MTQSKSHVWIIRIDPTKRTIAKIAMQCGKRPTDIYARKICKTDKVGMRPVMEMESGVKLCCFGGLDLEPPFDEFAFPGIEATGGIGFLGGQGPGGGLVDVPVSVDWVKDRIRWSHKEAEDEE